MTIKSILVPFSGEESEASALEVAFGLSKDFRAEVHCLHVSPDRKMVDYPMVGTASSVMDQFLSEVARAKNEKRMQAEALFEEYRLEHHMCAEGENTPSVEFHSIEGLVDPLVEKEGRLTDLIIVGSTIGSVNTEYENVVTTALFGTGKPVLITPNSLKNPVGDNIAIAWSGSAEGARAVSLAMPLLKLARKVTFFTIGKIAEGLPSASDAIKYVALHGIAAEETILKKKGSVGETLMNACKEQGVDTLVMGAYTHNRVRQMIIGGVTSYIMDHADISVFMTH